MRCTVNKLAKISGVSIRTLHWYDKIGLLKPAFYEANGYRYYEEEQLLQLQQILFFRELGFSLKDIQKMLMSNEFDKIKALNAHKQVLQGNIDRMHQLTNTIDKTTLHLRGTQDMTDKEIYSGFDNNKQNNYEKFVFNYDGSVAQDIIKEAFLKHGEPQELSEKELAELDVENNRIYRGISDCIDRGITQRADEVQNLIKQHIQMMQRFYVINKDVYLAYAQLYCEQADFRKFFDGINPKLADYIAEAMRYYAKNNLQ